MFCKTPVHMCEQVAAAVLWCTALCLFAACIKTKQLTLCFHMQLVVWFSSAAQFRKIFDQELLLQYVSYKFQPLIVYNMVCGVVSVYTSAGFIYVMATMDMNIHAYRPVEALQPFMILYWQTKIIELLDTVFMILRHRSRQVTFLHVYHHATMLMLTDYTSHYTLWPGICFMYCINSIVHIFLYFYYGLTAWYPKWNIPWKHKLTEIQLTQFAIDFVFAVIGYLYHGYCVYILIYLATMTILFSNFYIKAYLKGARAKKMEAAKKGNLASTTNGSVSNGYHKEELNGKNGVIKHEINGNFKLKHN